MKSDSDFEIFLDDFKSAPNKGNILCQIDDIKEGEGLEFSYREGSDILDIFILRKENKVYAFENTCPHAGTALNMDEGKFMERSGAYLMCHTHGALFEYITGECKAGPCNGAFLKKVAVELIGNNVIVG